MKTSNNIPSRSAFEADLPYLDAENTELFGTLRSAFEACLPYLDAENAELSGSSSMCI